MPSPLESPQFSRRQFLQAAAAAMATAAESQAARPTTRPNIVFLMADEFRHDALGCAGNAAIETPNLDRLASQGTRFARTYCQGPLCQPSRASLITGQYVHRHGITWNAMDMKPELPTMMKQLQQAGYITAKVGKTHFLESLLHQRGDMREGNRRFAVSASTGCLKSRSGHSSAAAKQDPVYRVPQEQAAFDGLLRGNRGRARTPRRCSPAV